MNKVVFATLALACLVGLASAASAAVSTQACALTSPTTYLGCGDISSATNCVLYYANGGTAPTAAGAGAAATTGLDCLVQQTGYYAPSTTNALLDATGVTDNQVCPSSCASNTACPTYGASSVTLSNGVVTVARSSRPSTLATLTCTSCASGYGAPSTSTISVTSPAVCTACTGTNCGSCYGDYPTKCATCATGYYADGTNTSAGTSTGTGSATVITWPVVSSVATGPTTCKACSSAIANCAACTWSGACLSCSTGYTLNTKTGKCFGAKLGAGLALAGLAVLSLVL